MAEYRDALRAAQRAMQDADWTLARAEFETALQSGPSGMAFDGLGQALWFLGDVADGIATREQAFEQYVGEGRCDDAARIAVWVSHQNFVAGRASAARGWLGRCERALADVEGECAGHGWLVMERARHSQSVDEQVAHARRAFEIAVAAGASDLEVFALSLLGRAEVAAGRRDVGIALLEEAMAAASAGRVRDVHTLAEAYCNLIIACTTAGEWERATEWCEVVDEFARRHQTLPLMGACRTVHADVLIATGRWDDAEDALASAIETHSRFVAQMSDPAIATLAELRVRQGRLAEARELLAGREEHPSALRAVALVRLAEGRPRAAIALLERGLRSCEGDDIRATQLLAPLVDACLACADHDKARAAVAAMARLSEASGIRVVVARGALAAARLALADGEADAATEAARRSFAAFDDLSMPLDAGEARLVLARAASDPDVAGEHARAACEAFRALGATRAMDEAAAVMRDLGAATPARGRTAGELTARETEVLALIALGMSNARIGQELVISEKTAGHHVSHILNKLGVSNRTEAAAHAARLSSD